MKRSCRSMLMVCVACVLAPGIVWSRAPAADTIAPGPVKNLQVQSAARALTLKFTAPGDDGASGTATGYDILYTLGPCAPGLAPTPSPPLGATIAPPLWTAAPRSSETLPYAGGTTDLFNLRSADNGDGLESGTAYCVAIRGRDEVGHTGPFAVADAATLGVAPGDDWPLTTRLAIGSTPHGAPHLAYPPNSANAVLGWMLPDSVGTYAAMQFAFDGGTLYTVGKGPLKGITGQTFRMVGIPGGEGKVGAMFAGVATGTSMNQYMLVEVGPGGSQTPEVVASGPSQSGGLELAASSGITYVLHDGVYNPVVALNRIITLTGSSKVSQLELHERVDGSWAPTPTVVLTQSGPASKNTYQGVELFTKPDADGTLGFVAPQCGIWIYAERRHSNPVDPNSAWVWRYWDVGPTGLTPGGSPAAYNDLLHVSFTNNGAPILARISAINGAMQINHPDLAVGGSDTPPQQTCNATSVRPNAWESLVVTPNPDLPYVRLWAVAETGGNVFLTGEQGEGNGRVVEQRLIYRCSGTTQWKVVAIDRVNSCCGTPRAPLFAPDGSVVKSYLWGYASREAPSKPYSSTPEDYVFIAKQPNNYCPGN